MNLIQKLFSSDSSDKADKISFLSVTISLNLYSEGSLKFFGKLFARIRKRESSRDPYNLLFGWNRIEFPIKDK